MLTQSLSVKKGAIIAYRVYDIAHEINLKSAKSILESDIASSATVKRYQLKKDTLRSIIFKEAPLIINGGEESFSIRVNEKKEVTLKAKLEIKVWNYGVVSLSYKMVLPEDLPWGELIQLGAILDTDSIIDQLAVKKRDELTSTLFRALKTPHTHSIFEDYTTYLIEELNSSERDKETKKMVSKPVKYPLDLLKTTGIAELLLAEPKKTLSESTHKSIQSNHSQYTKQDLLVMDWNSALVMDFGVEKDYQDYVDLLEFSLAQLLELRIYDELLDEKLDQLYDSMSEKQYNKVTEFYSKLSEDSWQLYMEFSDFFEKLDNSIKTVGDVYLAKVLKNADKKFGFDELKKSMSRKIDTLSKISQSYQDKVNSTIDTQRNNTSHRLEWIIIILIALELIPTFTKAFNYVADLLK